MNLDSSEPPTGGEVAVRVRNHRTDRICDLDLRVVAAPPAEGDAENPAAVEQLWTRGLPDGNAIESDGELYVESRLNPWAEELLVTLQYTDQRGRRWQIDPYGHVERVADPPPRKPILAPIKPSAYETNRRAFIEKLQRHFGELSPSDAELFWQDFIATIKPTPTEDDP